MKKIIKCGNLFYIISAFTLFFSGCSSLNAPPQPPSVDSYSAQDSVPVTEKQGLHQPYEKQTSASETDYRELTLDECVKIALEKNPARQSAAATVNIAEETVGIAKAPYYPEVSASAGYSRFQRHAFLPGNLPIKSDSTLIGPENDWTSAISARLTIYDFGERSARLGSALARKEAASDEAERIRQEIITGVHRSFYGLMAARQAKEVALKNLERNESQLKSAESRYEVGAVSRTDVLRARVGVADAKLSVVKTESMISMASGDLNTVMGLPVERSIKIRASRPEIQMPEKKLLDQAFIQAKEKRPELKAAMQKISAAKFGVEEAKSGFGPKLKAQASYGWEDDTWTPNDKTWLAGLSVEIPVFTGFAKTHNLAGKKAELKKEEAEAISLIQKVRQEVWKSYTRLKESFEAFQASESMVKEAEESHRSTKERYEAGAATITDLLDAQVSLTKADANRVNAKWDYYVSEAEFNKASGGL